MLANYSRDKNGVIFQINRGITKYDENYVRTRYSTAPVSEMSNLRLGFLIGSLGFIPKSVLDVGYGSGDFLLAAKNIVQNCYGYDVPPAYPLDGIKNVESIYEREFEVVSFFDSLEHFHDIYEIRKLKTNYILISVPWCHYFSDDWFELWKHRRPDEHYWHFDDKSLLSFMNEMGYSCISYTNIEDSIRKSDDGSPNILTAIFRKIEI